MISKRPDIAFTTARYVELSDFYLRDKVGIQGLNSQLLGSYQKMGRRWRQHDWVISLCQRRAGDTAE